ncbi:MAG TPA: hypothetical protein PK373_01955, partial [Sedimentisphaerales bacterium]|nr:hypothetical protein [Sedimentisphaerales bacterium]
FIIRIRRKIVQNAYQFPRRIESYFWGPKNETSDRRSPVDLAEGLWSAGKIGSIIFTPWRSLETADFD